MPAKATFQQLFAEDAIGRATRLDFTCLSGVSPVDASGEYIPAYVRQAADAIRQHIKAKDLLSPCDSAQLDAAGTAKFVADAPPALAVSLLIQWLRTVPKDKLIPANCQKVLNFMHMSNMADDLFVLLLVSMSEWHRQLLQFVLELMAEVAAHDANGLSNDEVCTRFRLCFFPTGNEGAQVAILGKLLAMTQSGALFTLPDDLVKLIELHDAVEAAQKDYNTTREMYMYRILSLSLSGGGTQKKELSAREKHANLLRFRKRFGFDKSEKILHEYQCCLQLAIPLNGTLYVSTTHVCFHGRLFGFDCVEKINLKDIDKLSKCNHRSGNIARDDVQNAIKVTTNEKSFTFFWNESAAARFSAIEDHWESQFFAAGGDSEDGEEEFDGSIEASSVHVDDVALAEEEWNNFMAGIEDRLCSKNDNLITEGKPSQDLYQIGHGTVRVTTTETGELMVLHKLVEGEMFGEIEFLEGMNANAVASVVANEDDAEIYVCPHDFMQQFMQRHPGIALRLFKNLAAVLASRLGKTSTVAYHRELARQSGWAIRKESVGDISRPGNWDSGKVAAQNLAGDANSKTNQSLRKRFDLPESESILLEYKCYWQKGEIPLAGRLYATNGVICFYAKLFAFEAIETILIKDVSGVEKSSHAGGKDNALTFKTKDGREMVFFWNSECDTAHTELSEHLEERMGEFANIANMAIDKPPASKASTISRRNLETFLQGAKRIVVKKGDIIIKRGEVSKDIYQISTGTIRVETGDGADRTVLNRLGAGDMFGEMEFLHGFAPAVADVLAHEDVEVYKCSCDFLNGFVNNEPAFAVHFFKFLADSMAKRLTESAVVHTLND